MFRCLHDYRRRCIVCKGNVPAECLPVKFRSFRGSLRRGNRRSRRDIKCVGVATLQVECKRGLRVAEPMAARSRDTFKVGEFCLNSLQQGARRKPSGQPLHIGFVADPLRNTRSGWGERSRLHWSSWMQSGASFEREQYDFAHPAQPGAEHPSLQPSGCFPGQRGARTSAGAPQPALPRRTFFDSRPTASVEPFWIDFIRCGEPVGKSYSEPRA